MTKYQKLIKFLRDCLPGKKEICRTLMFAGVMIAAGFFITIGSHLAGGLAQVNIEVVES